jgi:predicted  nucleic acid-binding Zn-ribbon protein
MTKKSRLQRVLSTITSFDSGAKSIFTEVDGELQKASDAVRKAVDAKTLSLVQGQFAVLKTQIKNIIASFKDVRESIDSSHEQLHEEFSHVLTSSLNGVISKIEVLEAQLQSKTSTIERSLEKTQATVSEVAQRKVVFPDIPDYKPELRALAERVDTEFKNLPKSADPKEVAHIKSSVEEIQDDIKRLRERFVSFASRGGGNANRNIAIGGNTSVLSKYTDINLKAGSNVTITYVNNNATKYTDVTIAATGGSGSVGGTVRSINTISTSQTAGATSGTDYVYICSAGVQLTLPTAASNTNLYTVKNTGSSSVLVATTGGETIDTSSNAVLPIQYTSLDLISDGTNWNVT